MDMRNLSERLADGVFISVTTVTLLVVATWWLSPTEEIEDDHFTVTIDCRAIIMQPDEFPEGIVTECRDKVRFIKDSPLSTV